MRRILIVAAVLVVVAVISVSIWMTSTLQIGMMSESDTSELLADRSVLDIIAKRTEHTRTQQDALRALLAQESINEPLAGILFLGYEHWAGGVVTRLEQIAFYPSATIATVTVRAVNADAVSLDPSSSQISQQVPGTGHVNLVALQASPEDPVSLGQGQQQELLLTFGPLNGELPFTLSLGSPEARFEVDPAVL